MLYQPWQAKESAAEAVEALQCAFDRSYVLDASEWLKRCADDLAQLWRNGTLWMITEVQSTKTGRAMNIVACAGDWDGGELLKDVEAFAKDVWCDYVFFTGRKGWAKRLDGYSVETVTMKKEI